MSPTDVPSPSVTRSPVAIVIPSARSPQPDERDFTLYQGATWRARIALYDDARLIRWRGEFNEEWQYLPGDGVLAEDGSVWVCTKRAQFTGPLAIGQSQWSAATALNLAGYTVKFEAEGVFSNTPTVEASSGIVNVVVKPSEIASAPSSAHHYLKLTDAGETVIYPLRGTLLFRKP